MTGIMVGSNRAAFLKDPHDGIVRGTLAAHVVTTSVYFLAAVFFGGSATSAYLLKNFFFRCAGAAKELELCRASKHLQ